MAPVVRHQTEHATIGLTIAKTTLAPLTTRLTTRLAFDYTRLPVLTMRLIVRLMVAATRLTRRRTTRGNGSPTRCTVIQFVSTALLSVTVTALSYDSDIFGCYRSLAGSYICLHEMHSRCLVIGCRSERDKWLLLPVEDTHVV